MHLPNFDAFQQLAQSGRLVPVYRRLLSDGLTPVSALYKLDVGKPLCLFESVVGGEKVGRYSFLGVNPFLELTAHNQAVTIATEDSRQQFHSQDPLQELRNRIQQYRAIHLPELPPFTGGAVGYAGYDVVRYVEHLPNPPEDDRHLPDLSFSFYDHAFAITVGLPPSITATQELVVPRSIPTTFAILVSGSDTVPGFD